MYMERESMFYVQHSGMAAYTGNTNQFIVLR